MFAQNAHSAFNMVLYHKMAKALTDGQRASMFKAANGCERLYCILIRREKGAPLNQRLILMVKTIGRRSAHVRVVMIVNPQIAQLATPRDAILPMKGMRCQKSRRQDAACQRNVRLPALP